MPDITIPESHWDYTENRPKLGSQWRGTQGGTVYTVTGYASDGVVTVDEGAGHLYYAAGIPAFEPYTEPEKLYTQADVDAAASRVRDQFLADIERANEILNERAVDAELCSSYEEALDAVNRAVSTFELKGRSQTYRVEFSVELPRDSTPSDLEGAVDRWLRENDHDECSNFNWEPADD